MSRNPDSPHYPYRPIGSLVALARMLKCPPDNLFTIANKADRLYRVASRKKKPDGTVRLCYDAMAPLKSIHARIQCLILKKVKFPAYLMGGICDPECPRDYVRNAELHTNARVVVNEDVSGFFPSTSVEVVSDIWLNFFKFPEDVARTLTLLTTKDGGLPQGAKTSSYLANLAFWRSEPSLYASLVGRGFRYGRYVDDIGLSSGTSQSNRTLGHAIARVAGMVSHTGMCLKRKKHHIMRSGEAQEITGLNVDKKASIKPEKRANLRAMVHRCELLAQEESGSAELHPLFRRCCCMVGQLNRLHPGEASLLRLRLNAVRGLLGRAKARS